MMRMSLIDPSPAEIRTKYVVLESTVAENVTINVLSHTKMLTDEKADINTLTAMIMSKGMIATQWKVYIHPTVKAHAGSM